MSKNKGITVRETKSGKSYQVRWRTESGSQASKTFDNIDEAFDFKATIRLDKRRGLLPDYQRSKMTFGEYASEWAAGRTDLKPSAAARRDGILKNYLLPALQHRRLTSIRSSDIKALVAKWSNEHRLSPRSILNHKHILSPIFDAAVCDDIIRKNPVGGVKFPKPGHVERHALSDDECFALLDAIDDDYEPLIHFALATGVRGGELVALNIGDLNLLKKDVRIRDSKTNAGVRSISLDDVTISHIARHLAATNRTGSSPEEPLFVSPSGKRLNHGNFYRRIFKPACTAAGFPDVKFHDLRRTRATMLVSQGVDAKVVQKRMGHRSIQTTLNFYAKAAEEGRREGAGALERYMLGGSAAGLRLAN